MERRLAAILSADIAGYSRLIGEDEAGMLATLRRVREHTIRPIVNAEHGRIIKDMGDGWLAVFDSAVHAVQGAIRLQDALLDEAKVGMRIGVHVGDVAHENEDIFGDGVNVAARLEALSMPGAISISDAVYGNLDGTLTPSFDDQGEHALKNIERPVRVWSRRSRRDEQGTAASATEVNHWPTLTIRIAANANQNVEAQELAQGIAGDLALYTGATGWIDARIGERAASDGYVLNATLRVAGERVRLQTELVGADGGTLWADRTDGRLADSFEWQDQTAGDIAPVVVAAIAEAGGLRIAAKPDAARSAGDWLLAAKLRIAGDRTRMEEAFGMAERAIAAAPDWDQPYLFGVMTFLGVVVSSRARGDRSGEDRLRRWLSDADARYGGDRAHPALAVARHVLDPDHQTLAANVDIGLRRRPFDTLTLLWASLARCSIGDAQGALDCGSNALRFIADHPSGDAIWGAMALARLQLGEYDAAIELARKSLALSPQFPYSLRVLAAALALSDRGEDARRTIRDLQAFAPLDSIENARSTLEYADTPGLQRYFEALRSAGLPEATNASD